VWIIVAVAQKSFIFAFLAQKKEFLTTSETQNDVLEGCSKNAPDMSHVYLDVAHFSQQA